MTLWKAYCIGPGKFLDWTDVKLSTVCTTTASFVPVKARIATKETSIKPGGSAIACDANKQTW